LTRFATVSVVTITTMCSNSLLKSILT
jgi:hypothetical protein